MTQIDEKALQAAILQGTVMIDRDDARKVVTAYLATSLPTGDVGELVEKARGQWNEWMRQPDNSSDPIHIEIKALIAWANSRPAGAFVLLADALAAAAARIAELEREASRAEIYRAVLESAGYQNIDTIKDVMNAKALGAVVACSFIGLQNNLATATARAERLEAAFKNLPARARHILAHGEDPTKGEIDTLLRDIAALSLGASKGGTKPSQIGEGWRFDLGDRVYKPKGASWRGKIVGFYTASLTPEGYAIESENEPGSVQIFPLAALAPIPSEGGDDGK